MPLFVDFEASGLHRGSYPIEVGWATPDGMMEGHLIAPTKAWLTTRWDPKAQSIHGIELERLCVVGEPVDQVAAALRSAAEGRRLFADNVSYDERWLAMLLGAAGVEAPDLRLLCADRLFKDMAATQGADLKEVEFAARKRAPRSHRADKDALYLATMFALLTA